MVLPAAPSTAPLVDALRALVVQSVIDPPLLLLDDLTSVRRLGPAAESDTTADLLHEIESARCDRFLLVNLVTADAVQADRGVPNEVPPELRTAFQVDLLIRNALAAKVGPEEKANQNLDVLNLVVSASERGSVPRDLHSRGPNVAANVGGWTNVLVAPEVQQTSSQASVPVTPDEQYVAHVAAALVSLCGSWAGSSWEPRYSWTGSGSVEPGQWTVVKSRSRSLVAPELPERVLGRLGQASRRVPVHDVAQFQVAPEPGEAIDLAERGLVDRASLRPAVFADVSFQPPPRTVSIREFLRLLLAWLTGNLPQKVAEVVQERVDRIRDGADATLNSAFGLDQRSTMKVRLFARRRTSAAALAEPSSPDGPKKVWTFVSAEPQLWAELRALSFGLLDGGDLPDHDLRELIGAGNERFVLGDPLWISPAPGRQVFEPSRITIEAGIGPSTGRHLVDIEWAEQWQAGFERLLGPEAEDAASRSGTTSTPPQDREERNDVAGGGAADESLEQIREDRRRFRRGLDGARRSLLWRIGEVLHDSRAGVEHRLAHLREELEEVRSSDPAIIDAETKQTKRRALGRLLLTALVLGVLGALAWVGLAALAIGGALLVLLAVLVAVALLWGAVRALWRCVYSWFLADHRRLWITRSRAEIIQEAIEREERQLRRFIHLCFAHREWSDVVGTVCHHPFRTPKSAHSFRVRNAPLFLPSSHQVKDGHTTAVRLDGLVSAVASSLMNPGWLSTTYESALAYASDEHRLRTRGGSFDPDADITSDEANTGSRRALRDAIESGRARHRRELEVLREIHASIRSGRGFLIDPADSTKPVEDRLFAPLADGRSPASFLTEPSLGQPSNFNRSFTPFDARVERVATARSDEVELPELPDTEALIDGASVDFPPLVFSAWAIEAVVDVPDVSLSVLADSPTPALLDLSRAVTLWQPPPDVDVAEVDFPPVDDSSWELPLGDVPVVGQVIRSDRPPTPRTGTGPYTFVVEVDGEPAVHPVGSPIRYSVRRDYAPPGAMGLVTRALQCVAENTGYEFVFDGTFEGVPSRRTGRIEIGWASGPEFMRWTSENQPDAPESVIGWGGPSARVQEDGQVVCEGGLVLLRADTGYELSFAPNRSHGNVLLHELGHVMNLNHVSDPREVMTVGETRLDAPLDFGPGDAAGLRHLVSIASRT